MDSITSPQVRAEQDAKRKWAHDNGLLTRTLVSSGILVWGSLYVAGVFVAGLHEHLVVARDLAVITAGITYMAFVSQLPPQAPDPAPDLLTAASMVSGFLAGLALLLGV